MRWWHFVLFTVSGLLISCSAGKKSDTEQQIEELMTLMEGSFSNDSQATADEDYLNVTLHMREIWKEKSGEWLYVEQKMADQKKPYRQRVYRLVGLPEGGVKSIVYELRNPALFKGKWSDPTFFDDFDFEIISIREGCGVVLKRIGDRHFKGSTDGNNCNSNYQSASYTTSQVEIMEGEILSWDRGFDENDQQVWGAEKGPYIFKPIEDPKELP